MKTAFLITFSQTVRVITAGDNPTDEEVESAFVKAHEVLTENGAHDTLEKVELDTECPFGTFDTDK